MPKQNRRTFTRTNTIRIFTSRSSNSFITTITLITTRIIHRTVLNNLINTKNISIFIFNYTFPNRAITSSIIPIRSNSSQSSPANVAFSFISLRISLASSNRTSTFLRIIIKYQSNRIPLTKYTSRMLI